MKRITGILKIFVAVLLLCGCTNDELREPGQQDREGTVTVDLVRTSAFHMSSRAEDEADDAEAESIENVAIFVFDAAGNKNFAFVHRATGDITSVDLYLTSRDKEVYMVCNYHSADDLVDEITNTAELENRSFGIDGPEGAMDGHYVMVGKESVETLLRDKKIYMERLASHLNITVNVALEPNKAGVVGDFKFTGLYLCNLPRGSYMFAQEGRDYGAGTGTKAMRERYFDEVKLNAKENGKGMTAQYDLYENPRGSMTDDLANWPEIEYLNELPVYQQMRPVYKRQRAYEYSDHIGEFEHMFTATATNREIEQAYYDQVSGAQFFCATYVRVEGVFQFPNESAFKTTFYVYLGEDNYKDYNVKRNTIYNHEITIRQYDSFDHRVSGESLSEVSVYGELTELDAHFNTVRMLMFSPEDWTLEVENPDATPWLELSHISQYVPRLHGGGTPTADAATYMLEGRRGLDYFYVHTDEYIPDIKSPDENDNVVPRKGSILYKTKTGKTLRLEVTQLPAKIAIYYRKYDPLYMTEVCDTFYVERRMEEKFMKWGFIRYWSAKMDLRISRGEWDGYGNTLTLHEVGSIGDDNYLGDNANPNPAYPQPKGFYYDHAIGYILSKNRDRNGNGQIDADEIVWYMPAWRELQEIQRSKDKLTDVEGLESIIFSSTPSTGDRQGVTAGYVNAVKMNVDYVKLNPFKNVAVVPRDRKYNVIGCRQKHPYRGPQTGGVTGGVNTDPEWDDDQEVIIPKAK